MAKKSTKFFPVKLGRNRHEKWLILMALVISLLVIAAPALTK